MWSVELICLIVCGHVGFTIQVGSNSASSAGTSTISMTMMEHTPGARCSDVTSVTYTGSELRCCHDCMKDRACSGVSYQPATGWCGKSTAILTGSNTVAQPGYSLYSVIGFAGCDGVFESSCYIMLIDVERTWQDNKVECETKGGHLADITTQEENDFIIDMIEASVITYASWYIGGNDLAKEGDWRWSDGSNVYDTFVYWKLNEPSNYFSDEHCMELRISMGSQYWNDIPCDLERKAVCEFE